MRWWFIHSSPNPRRRCGPPGIVVDRVILRPEDGFVLDPRAVPADADLVVIGNPTNPTSVLHRADDLRELARPDRILVVDEAFMDAVPGEPESLAGASIPGLVVIRSLTKTWGLAGLRIGYVLAAPGLIEQLAAVQPHWPVSTPALAAAIACSNERAVSEAATAALDIERQRVHLLDNLGSVSGLFDVRRGARDRSYSCRSRGAPYCGNPCGTRGLRSGGATRFPGSGRTGCGSPYGRRTSPMRFVKVLRDLTD